VRYFLLAGLWVCVTVYAAAWTPIGMSDYSRFDIDKDSIEHENNRVRAWFQENTDAIRRTPMGREYRSAVTLEIFDCVKRTTALEKAIYYSELDKMGKVVGDFSVTVTDADFSPVVPGSIGEIKLKNACPGRPAEVEEGKLL